MPSSYLHDSIDAPDLVTLCTLLGDWPVELIEAELTVTTPEKLNAFQWVVVRLLQEFKEVLPKEMAIQLGLADPVLLGDPLKSLETNGAVARQDPDQPLSLENATLTATARNLLREGQVPGPVEHHGLHVHFDAITREHRPSPARGAKKAPREPLFEVCALPPKTERLGLDRVRELCNRQGEPYHKGESRISDVKVDPEQGRYVWEPVEISLVVDGDGVFHLQINTDAGRQVWLDQHGWSIPTVQNLETAATAAWANGRCNPRLSAIPATSWRSRAGKVIEPASVPDQARQSVASAEKQVVVHVGWLDCPGIEQALALIAQRGIPCFICGAAPGMSHWTVAEGQGLGFVASGGIGGSPRPLALIVDECRGISIDRLSGRTPDGSERTIEIASSLNSSSARSLLSTLLQGMPESLIGNDPRQLIAVFCLNREPGSWRKAIAILSQSATGAEQAAQLERWAAAAGIRPEAPPKHEFARNTRRAVPDTERLHNHSHF